MSDGDLPAERLIYLSSGARRLADLIAAAEAPARYEVLRHLLRVSEETMTEVLEEAVGAGLVVRGGDPFTYVPASDAIAAAIREGMGEERLLRLRGQMESARGRVME
jgi:hypothetical protein